MKHSFNDGKVDLIAVESMQGFQLGLKFFDDDTKVFVSPQIQELFLENKLERLDFVTLSYRKGQKTIDEVMDEIWEVVDSATPGELTEHQLNIHHIHHGKEDNLRKEQRKFRAEADWKRRGLDNNTNNS